MHEAELWHVDADRIRCELCPNECRIRDGGVGTCGVRRNEAGTLYAMTYGLISSLAADPIEKKPVFHYRPGSSVLSLGSIGCSMRCGHCQNWQISRAGLDDGAGLRELAPADIVDLARRNECPGVAFTYNEPIIWAEYVRDVSVACHEAGLFTIMVTNGYITEAGMEFLGDHIDVWRVDVKGASDATYRSLCHVPTVEPVLYCAQQARNRWGAHVEIVTNIVPTVNDSVEELKAIAEWIAKEIGVDTPWHVTRFFPYLDYSDLSPTPGETLQMARSLGREAGLHYVYVGNYDEPGAEDTMCPGCGALVVGRSGYTIHESHTREGSCIQCGRDLNIIE